MRRIITVISAVLLSFSLTVGATVIADYQFVDNASKTVSSDSDSLTTAGAFTNGPGVVMLGTSAIAASNRSLMNDNTCTFYSLDETGAISQNDYYSFPIAVDAEHIVSYTSLSFSTLRFPTDGAGAPRAWSLRSSADGFAATIGTGTVVVAASDSTSESFAVNTVDLSGVAALQSQSAEVEFRLYFYDRDTNEGPSARIFRIDDVVVEGTVSAINGSMSQVIADYRFVDNESIPDSSDSQSQTTANGFAAGAGITMGYTSAIAASGRSLMNNNNGFFALDEAGALGGNDYFYFSVSIDSGYQVNYSNLTFSTLRFPTDGAGAPRAYSLRVYDGTDWSIVGSGSVDVAASDDITEPFASNTVDLSGIASLQSTTNQVFFRLYFYDRNTSAASTERIFRIDDVKVNGTVAEYQEPVLAATLSVSLGSDSITVSSDDLSAVASSNVLQTTDSLVFPNWSNVSVCSGISSTNWVVSPLTGETGFFRILTFE